MNTEKRTKFYYDDKDRLSEVVTTYTEIKEEAKPQYIEVDRLAEVGEWIKLIDAPYSHNKIGDVLRVSLKDGAIRKVGNKNHPRCGNRYFVEDYLWPYEPKEYVVLEGYQP